MIKLILLFLLILPPVSYSNSGWIITERTSGKDTDITLESTLYIKDNMIKSVDQEQQLIFDLNQWKLTVLNTPGENYWDGTPSEYLEEMMAYAIVYLEEEIRHADELNRPYLEALYEDLKMEIKQADAGISFIGELPVDIVMTGARDRMLGYTVDQYVVYVDGIRVEELWLARDISLEEQYDFEKFRAFSDEMTWGLIFQDYRSSRQYIHLLKQGLPLKTIELHEDGSVSVTEATRVEYTEVPEETFMVPAGWQPMPLSESMTGLY